MICLNCNLHHLLLNFESSLRIVAILNPRAIATAVELSSTTQNRFNSHQDRLQENLDYVSSFRNQTPCFFVSRVRYAPSSASSGRVEGNVQGAKATNFMTKRIEVDIKLQLGLLY